MQFAMLELGWRWASDLLLNTQASVMSDLSLHDVCREKAPIGSANSYLFDIRQTT